MGKHKPQRKPPNNNRGSESERTESHMQTFARLASIKNMHSHPGPRKPKKG